MVIGYSFNAGRAANLRTWAPLLECQRGNSNVNEFVEVSMELRWCLRGNCTVNGLLKCQEI